MAIRAELGRHSWMLAVAVVAMAGLASSALWADQVILDDLIVNGSECIGLDCEADMEFAFCTEVLMENNLRIFFNDTSTTSMFPKNDWEIVANDSNNGGASYLGFADRGAGLVDACGQGFCEGGDNDGLACGIGVGDCLGVCVDSGYPDVSCSDDAQCDLSHLPGGSVGTCEGEGICVPTGAIIFRIEAGGPADSLVIDGAGDVAIAGDLTVGGSINGDTTAIEELQEQIAALQAEIEAIKSFPPIRQFLSR